MLCFFYSDTATAEIYTLSLHCALPVYLLMLTDFQPMEGSNRGRWAGHILDPDTGHLYDSQIWTIQPDVLKLRGYIGLPIFGETQTWTRYKGPAMGPVCKIPDSVK